MRKFGYYTSIFGLTVVVATTANAQSTEPSKVIEPEPTTAKEVPAAAESNSKSTKDSAADAWDTDRSYSYYRFNSLRGGTGLLHLLSADSGAPGTFRVSFLSSNFSGSGFLCPSVEQCGGRPARVTDTQDTAGRTGADLAISATLLPFLEANVGTHSHGFSNNFGSPSVIQVLGDSYFGLKGFMPRKAGRIFSSGAFGNLHFLNSAGDIGIKTANVTLAALATMDLSNRSDAKKRVPVRVHANMGYLFDNSSKIAEHIEQVRHHPITRIERVGFGINRVDSLFMGLGAEYTGKVLQPFAEWSLDIASNRQGYKCIARNSWYGDRCLARANGMSGTPSRLTLGTRITPKFYGLSGVVAFDIGTSSTSTFVEERATELPWNFYLGLAYAIDIVPPKAVVVQTPGQQQIIEVTPPEYHIVGSVVDEENSQPIARAIVQFETGDKNGLVTKADGSFDSGNVKPGTFRMSITAEGYKDGSCEATVESTHAASKDHPKASEAQNTEIKCKLKAAPALGVLYGTLVDSESSAPIAQASIKVRDERERTLELQSNATGEFRVENVPAGRVHLLISAPGYLPMATEAEIKKKVEQHASLVLRKVPTKANVKVTPQELKLTTQIRFDGTSAELARESMPIVQELAAALSQHPEFARVEIQVFTDEDGSVIYNKRLSEQRAGALRGALSALGVDASRLVATGMGSEKPVVPSAKSEADHAKNRRVRLLVQKDD